jgi:hypothetical protein
MHRPLYTLGDANPALAMIYGFCVGGGGFNIASGLYSTVAGGFSNVPITFSRG